MEESKLTILANPVDNSNGISGPLTASAGDIDLPSLFFMLTKCLLFQSATLDDCWSWNNRAQS